MKKVLTALSLSLGLIMSNPTLAAQKEDLVDPIYENKALPTNFYEYQKTSNYIVFRNDKTPNMEISISFSPIKNQKFYEIVANYMYELTHTEGTNISHCQIVPTYKNFASYEFECTKNQDSLMLVIFTIFEDDNNQPSDFIRTVSIAAKTGDAPSSEDVIEMINYANFNLGKFESFNIPQKSVLRPYSEPSYKNIELEGMEQLVNVDNNLWNGIVTLSGAKIINQDLTNAGLKYFVKSDATNEKFKATLFLDKRTNLEAITQDINDSLIKFYHKCKNVNKNQSLESSSLEISCDEGELAALIFDYPIKKYEFTPYLVISGPKQLLMNTLSSQINSLKTFFYKEYIDREILHYKNNIFNEMLEVEEDISVAAPKTYPIDDTLKQSIVALKSIPNKTNQTDQNNNANSNVTNAQNVPTKHEQDDSLYLIIGGVLLTVALLLMLLKNKIAMMKLAIKTKQLEKEEEKKTGVPINNDGGGELLAEIEAARIQREKEIYKQRREAENLAKELEKKLSEDKDEVQKRKDNLDQFTQSTPDSIVEVLNKKTVEPQNDEERVHTTSSDVKVKTPKGPKQVVQDNNTDNFEEAIITEQQGNIVPEVEEEPKQSVEEDLLKVDESNNEISEEEKRKNQEKQNKLDSLLAKMKETQSSGREKIVDSNNDDSNKLKETVQNIEKTTPKVKFSLVSDKDNKDNRTEDKPKVSNPFNALSNNNARQHANETSNEDENILDLSAESINLSTEQDQKANNGTSFNFSNTGLEFVGTSNDISNANEFDISDQLDNSNELTEIDISNQLNDSTESTEIDISNQLKDSTEPTEIDISNQLNDSNELTDVSNLSELKEFNQHDNSLKIDVETQNEQEINTNDLVDITTNNLSSANSINDDSNKNEINSNQSNVTQDEITQSSNETVTEARRRKIRTSKRIRRFNMGSLSISLQDDENNNKQ